MDLEEIKLAADNGSPEAHEKLSDFYLFEYPPNRQLSMHHIEMARKLYSVKAESSSDPERLTKIGCLFLQPPIDFEKAQFWLLKAVAWQSTQAMFKLAFMYSKILNGSSDKYFQDEDIALFFLNIASQLNAHDSYYYIAKIHEFIDPRRIEPDKILNLYKKAAENNSPMGQFTLASWSGETSPVNLFPAHLAGLLEINYETAYFWYRVCSLNTFCDPELTCRSQNGAENFRSKVHSDRVNIIEARVNEFVKERPKIYKNQITAEQMRRRRK